MHEPDGRERPRQGDVDEDRRGLDGRQGLQALRKRHSCQGGDARERRRERQPDEARHRRFDGSASTRPESERQPQERARRLRRHGRSAVARRRDDSRLDRGRLRHSDERLLPDRRRCAALRGVCRAAGRRDGLGPVLHQRDFRRVRRLARHGRRDDGGRLVGGPGAPRRDGPGACLAALRRAARPRVDGTLVGFEVPDWPFAEHDLLRAGPCNELPCRRRRIDRRFVHDAESRPRVHRERRHGPSRSGHHALVHRRGMGECGHPHHGPGVRLGRFLEHRPG